MSTFGIDPASGKWALAVSALSVVVSAAASIHVVLKKRDTRSAIAWIGLIWLSPFLGTAAYVVLGINRISRKAQSLRKDRPRADRPPAENPLPTERLIEVLGPSYEHLEPLARVFDRLTGRPLLAGNRLEPLADGPGAYPAMLRAIDEASRSIALATYIFNDDAAGRTFLEALARAKGRGVEIRVLVDDIGAHYDFPPVTWALRRAGIRHATFVPSWLPTWLPYMNLRNHRKILVVDGLVGFTGGMNIDGDYLRDPMPKHPKRDLHFRVEGPVVADLMHTFAEDWAFCAREVLEGEPWFPHLEPVGPVLARGLTDGPDEDMDKVLDAILGAVACARSAILIVTPYFLPEAPLMSALTIAAMRGVRVDIILPRKNNLNLVKWASTALLGQLIERGCHLWYSPPPFDHTKLMIVDGAWSFLGSANMDPRSLRLNFEFNVECYDPDLAATLLGLVDDRLRVADPITLDDLDARTFPVKLRDGVVRLLMPYL